MSKTIRHLHLIGATGTIREATFNGIKHLAVPVVAMVEGVVWAVNSEYPELVLAEELARTPQQWNGRPCFAGHPVEDGGKAVTANTPATLEKSFGWVFHASSEEQILATKKLVVEAYLDPVKAKSISTDAEGVIQRLQSGEQVEVSIGCYIISEQTEGVHSDGNSYAGIWRDITSDHLAFLSEGETGACSIVAGCGAPRTAIRHLITVEGIRQEGQMAVARQATPAGGIQPPAVPPPKRGLKDRLVSLLTSLRDTEGLSDRDVRYALDAALRAIEPGYIGIDAVYPDDKIVIYSTMPEDEWKTLRRSYTLSEKGEVTLGKKAEEVEPVTTYEPVTAGGVKTCSCGRQSSHITTEVDMNRIELIKTLMASEHNPLKDQKALEAATDDALQALSTHCQNAATLKAAADQKAAEDKAAAEKTAADKAAADKIETDKIAAAAGAKTPTTEEWLKTAPQEVRDLVERTKKADQDRTKVLVESLKTAQSEFTEAELQAMPVVQLERLARLSKVDFSGQGVPRAAGEGDIFANPPDPWAEALKARREARSVN